MNDPRYVRVTVQVDDAETGEPIGEVEVFKAEGMEYEVKYDDEDERDLETDRWFATPGPPQVEQITFTVRNPLHDLDNGGAVYVRRYSTEERDR